MLAASPADAKTTYSERALKRSVNKVRAAHGLRPLRVGTRIQRGAHRYAVYLRRNDAFHHSGVSGAYENLAYNPISAHTARSVVSRWMNSPAHRATVLRRGARVAGFGVSRGEFLGYSRMQVTVLRVRA